MKEHMQVIQIVGLEEHHLSKNNPVMLDDQFQALKEDIKLNGQLMAIKLYKGKIIDGRHRVRAINELAIENGTAREKGKLGGVVAYESLPNNTPLTEVVSIISSLETRRMQTKTQLTAAAFKKASLNPKMSNADAAKMKGVPVSGVNRCARINKLMGANAIDKLIAGESVVVTTVNGSPRETTSIQFIYKVLGEVAKKAEEQSKRYALTDVDADKLARRYLKDLTKSEAKILALAIQNRAFSMLED
jgi:hypothetical protein